MLPLSGKQANLLLSQKKKQRKIVEKKTNWQLSMLMLETWKISTTAALHSKRGKGKGNCCICRFVMILMPSINNYFQLQHILLLFVGRHLPSFVFCIFLLFFLCNWNCRFKMSQMFRWLAKQSQEEVCLLRQVDESVSQSGAQSVDPSVNQSIGYSISRLPSQPARVVGLQVGFCKTKMCICQLLVENFYQKNNIKFIFKQKNKI